MKKILILAVSFFVLFGCLETEKPKPKKTAPAPASNLPPKGWVYSTDEDKMDGTKSYFANLISTNMIEFKFMNAKSWFRLLLRNKNKKNEVMLIMTEEIAGQFMPSLFSNETCRVKFDNAPPVNFGYNSNTSDGSSHVIFFLNPQKFITNLKTAEKLMIECEFYQEGKKIIEFNVKGLEWNR